ncbi:cupin domain-containing protein [Curtobacterium sp. MCJR17_055]|uniref:(R)-mandelonitrile lyase n=1 Tax=unclassified Curtobacterium TaxID=257496 RepID=UPI000D985620|nr:MULTISPECIES: cupin domain-containing protein [unclassified Curtobacterium]PYY33135.1 cupin domain-containing protein [Curtobacterium sp. MCBD17_029]PYY53808.1 cupin domain-containing protein [Curtobacterium sp. MCJR17_055]PYY59303.1 cupin domain-containing protein [Curtobacterium sp. MCPF17_015]
MEHRSVTPTAHGPGATFTGDVWVTPITGPTAPSRLTAALVRFTPGARSNWHSHDVGQTLHGVEGSGFVGTRDGRVVRIRAGETVWPPPGEEHWHGAADDTLMAHLALLDVNEDGSDPTRWLEPVTDEQYQAAHTSAGTTR